jgi:putative redox protein
MVPQQTLYLGDLRCASTHGPSSVELITDAPLDNQGKGASFSPTDLVVTALATCIVTTAGILARRENVALEGTKIFSEKHMATEGPRRILKIILRFEMPRGIPTAFRPKFDVVVRTCPVRLSLNPEVTVGVTVNYPD